MTVVSGDETLYGGLVLSVAAPALHRLPSLRLADRPGGVRAVRNPELFLSRLPASVADAADTTDSAPSGRHLKLPFDPWTSSCARDRARRSVSNAGCARLNSAYGTAGVVLSHGFPQPHHPDGRPVTRFAGVPVVPHSRPYSDVRLTGGRCDLGLYDVRSTMERQPTRHGRRIRPICRDALTSKFEVKSQK